MNTMTLSKATLTKALSLAVVVLSLAACKKNELPKAAPKDIKVVDGQGQAKTTPVTAPPPGPGQTAPPPGPAPAVPRVANLDCDQFVPKAARDKFLPGANLRQDAAPPHQGSCTFLVGTSPTVIAVACTDWDEATFANNMAAGQRSLKGSKPVTGVGKMGYQGEMMGGMHMMQFRDDDTNCYVTINTIDADLIGLGKAVAAALTPAVVAGAK